MHFSDGYLYLAAQQFLIRSVSISVPRFASVKYSGFTNFYARSQLLKAMNFKDELEQFSHPVNLAD